MNVTHIQSPYQGNRLHFLQEHCSIEHRLIKRGFDVGFSSLVLLIGAPFLLLLCLLVKCTSPGPIFYGSIRVGRGGKLIKCWKIRSMFQDADKRIKQLLAADPVIREEWTQYRKLKKDPRITPLGKFLRKTSLDEFPQFWNVLKGDMSVVGPRPFLLEELRQRIPESNMVIFCMRPGLTGLWQTSGRSLLSFEERISLEKQYVETYSFLHDLLLIAKTIPMVLFPRGAF